MCTVHASFSFFFISDTLIVFTDLKMKLAGLRFCFFSCLLQLCIKLFCIPVFGGKKNRFKVWLTGHKKTSYLIVFEL